MAKTRSPYLRACAQHVCQGVILAMTMTMAAVAVAQQPANSPGPNPAPLPPGLPADFNPAAQQPVPVGQAESLETAWEVALRSDERIAASQWNVSAAQSGWSAARAERFPSLTLGANYYAIDQEPAAVATLGPLGTQRLPLANRDSGGAHAFVTQPIYTSGRISKGIDAARANVVANEADHNRTVLDVKMNVADIYVKVLLATRVVEVAESKVVSLRSHDKDVSALYEKGVVSKNDLLASQVALADAEQRAIDARADLEVVRAAYNRALGRELAQPVSLAELPDPEAPPPLGELTQAALSQRPELTSLSAQARALQDEAASLRGKKGPQVSVTGGYLYQRDDYIQPNGITGAMVNVEWNAFDFGRVRNQARVLDEKSQALIRLRRDAASIITLEVRQKWIDLETARERVLVARKTTAQADENLRVARDRYQQQVGTNTEVLDAETLWVQAYTNLYNSTYQAALAKLRLRRAVGDL
jgi:outer membrane protein